MDASTLIALARIGELALMRVAFGRVHTSRTVFAEANHPEYPDSEAVRKAQDEKWLVVEEDATESMPETYGLGRGESSLFGAVKPGDAVVVDDAGARRLADARGVPRMGVVGIIVALAGAGDLTPERALNILDRLASTGFWMTPDLRARAAARIVGKRS